MLTANRIHERKIRPHAVSCGHCVETIQKAVNVLKGVRKVAVSLEKNEVAVDFDENSTTPAEISARIKEAGFEVLGLK